MNRKWEKKNAYYFTNTDIDNTPATPGHTRRCVRLGVGATPAAPAGLRGGLGGRDDRDVAPRTSDTAGTRGPDPWRPHHALAPRSEGWS